MAVPTGVPAGYDNRVGREILDLPAPPPDARIRYGPDPLHFADLRLPSGPGPHPVVIVIHGGFWRAKFGLEYAGHMCEALRAPGAATWNLEYRRMGHDGGGWPGTCEDVVAGARQLAELSSRYSLDLRRVAAMGHSAGGHLALWLAAERALPLRGVVSLAGVADLKRAWELRLGDGVVEQFLGATPDEAPERYAQASPIERLPLHVPSRLVCGTEDDIVPIEISRRFVEAAARRGDDARLVPLDGAGHFEPVDPRTPEWSIVCSVVLDLLRYD